MFRVIARVRPLIYRTYLVSLLKRLTGKNYRHFGKFSLIHTEQRFWQRYQMDSILVGIEIFYIVKIYG